MAVNPAVQKHYDDMKVFMGETKSSLINSAEDQETLLAKILELQSTPAVLTPEDQALLDEIQTLAQANSDSAKTLSEKVPTLPVPPAG